MMVNKDAMSSSYPVITFHFHSISESKPSMSTYTFKFSKNDLLSYFQLY